MRTTGIRFFGTRWSNLEKRFGNQLFYLMEV